MDSSHTLVVFGLFLSHKVEEKKKEWIQFKNRERRKMQEFVFNCHLKYSSYAGFLFSEEHDGSIKQKKVFLEVASHQINKKNYFLKSPLIKSGNYKSRECQ